MVTLSRSIFLSLEGPQHTEERTMKIAQDLTCLPCEFAVMECKIPLVDVLCSSVFSIGSWANACKQKRSRHWDRWKYLRPGWMGSLVRSVFFLVWKGTSATETDLPSLSCGFCSDGL
jgi:hypothetical protein